MLPAIFLFDQAAALPGVEMLLPFNKGKAFCHGLSHTDLWGEISMLEGGLLSQGEVPDRLLNISIVLVCHSRSAISAFSSWPLQSFLKTAWCQKRIVDNITVC